MSKGRICCKDHKPGQAISDTNAMIHSEPNAYDAHLARCFFSGKISVNSNVSRLKDKGVYIWIGKQKW